MKNKKITTVTVGNHVTKIGIAAFQECTKLTKVTIGNKVTHISNRAFYRCTKLKTITIGSGLKELGKHAFCHAEKLRTMTIKSKKLTKVGEHTMYNLNNLTIRVPSSKVKTYKKMFAKHGQKKNVSFKKY